MYCDELSLVPYNIKSLHIKLLYSKNTDELCLFLKHLPKNLVLKIDTIIMWNKLFNFESKDGLLEDCYYRLKS
jgi:hypothetical protein